MGSLRKQFKQRDDQNNRFRLALLVALGFVMPSAPIALAEETGRKIEEVIVTAERREASIQDTVHVDHGLTTEFMDDFGIRNQEDLQNFVPAQPFSLMTPPFVVWVETSEHLVGILVLRFI